MKTIIETWNSIAAVYHLDVFEKVLSQSDVYWPEDFSLACLVESDNPEGIVAIVNGEEEAKDQRIFGNPKRPIDLGDVVEVDGKFGSLFYVLTTEGWEQFQPEYHLLS